MNDTLILILSLAAIAVCVCANFFWKVNMGLAAMTAAFIIGCLFVGDQVSTIFSYWPDNLIFFMIASNLFFGYARENGTLELFGRKILWLFRGSTKAIAWVFMALAIVLGVLGAGPGTIVLLAPIAFAVAGQLGMNPVILAYAVNEGYSIGTMNPWTGTGVVLYGLVEEAGVANYTGVYLRTYLAMSLQKILFVGIVWALFTWLVKYKRKSSLSGGMAALNEEPGAYNPVQRKTLALVIGSFTLLIIPNIINTLFTIDAVWFTRVVALCRPHAVLIFFALLANIFKLAKTHDVLENLPMNTVLTIAGVCFLMEIAKGAGLLEGVSAIFSGGHIPRFLVPAVFCLLGGFMSLFASGTSVVLPLMFPLVPALSEATGIPLVTLYAAAQIGALTTPFSPFSTAGSLLVGLAPEEDKNYLFRTQFVLALIFLVAGFVLVGLGYCNLFGM